MGCKNNNSLVRPIDWFNMASVRDIIERSVFITYLSNIIKDKSLENKYIVEIIMSWKVWTLVLSFKNIQNKCKNNKG